MIDMPTLAFAMCGSFCTFEKALAQLALLRKDWDMLPVMSETAYTTDTRFGTAESFHERIENICGRKIQRRRNGCFEGHWGRSSKRIGRAAR